ncbi:DUF4238 domain-containing protein [Caproicibacterium sp. NSD3]
MGKRQHYVPQFYLKNFSDKNQKSIGLYRFTDQKLIINASIKDIAYRNNFYDEDNSIENTLTNMEGRWNEILNVFIGKNIPADTMKWVEKEKDEIAYDIFQLFAVTEARTAQQGDSVFKMIKTIETKVGSEMPSDNYNRYFGSMPELKRHPSNVSLSISGKSIPFYGGLDLLVIYNTSNIKFITSDAPIFSINPYYQKRKYNNNFGLRSMGLQKFLPISGDVCLCLYDRNTYIKRGKSPLCFIHSGHTINILNQLSVKNAYEQVFFSVGGNEEYIKTLCRCKKSADNHSRVKFWGKDKPVLIQAYNENIRSSFLLPCLTIKKSSMRITFPKTGDLIRPEVQSLYIKNI